VTTAIVVILGFGVLFSGFLVVWFAFADNVSQGHAEREFRRAQRKYIADSVKAMDEFDRKQKDAKK